MDDREGAKSRQHGDKAREQTRFHRQGSRIRETAEI
jgi:hypothetical protein